MRSTRATFVGAYALFYTIRVGMEPLPTAFFKVVRAFCRLRLSLAQGDLGSWFWRWHFDFSSNFTGGHEIAGNGNAAYFDDGHSRELAKFVPVFQSYANGGAILVLVDDRTHFGFFLETHDLFFPLFFSCMFKVFGYLAGMK